MPLRIIVLLVLTSFPLLSRADTAQAIFAGGCFWCMEYEYQEVEGVSDVISGFSGGKTDHPTYKGNHKGHFEAVQVTYDPSVVSYPELLSIFWRSIDPFDNAGQFCDKGPSYRTAIFTANDEERTLAVEGRDAVTAQFPAEKVHTEIRDAGGFWPVEEGHQDYYLKNPVRYKYYRWNCGRDQRLKDIWGDSARH